MSAGHEQSTVCGALKRKTKETCRGKPMPNGRCRIHGGKSLSGLASPTLVTGRHSRYLPTRLISRYEQAVSDPEILNLRDDIALLDTRIGSVVEALDTGESKETWTLLSSTWRSFEDQWKQFLDTGEAPEDMEQTVDYITKLMRDGLSQGYVWNEIRGLIKERADLVANERKRLVELQQYVTSEKALLFVHAVMASVKQHVSDRTALAAISSDLARLSDVRDSSQSAATG